MSALIHAATMVAAGVFLVARLMPLFELAPDVLLIVAAVGLFTFVFAGTIALVMRALKRALAYSTVSHQTTPQQGEALRVLRVLRLGIQKTKSPKKRLVMGEGMVNHPYQAGPKIQI